MSKKLFIAVMIAKKIIFFLVFLLPSISFAATVSLNLHPVRLVDLARVVYGDLLRHSYTIEGDFLNDRTEVSINWQNIQASKVDVMTRDLIRSKGFEIKEEGKVLSVRRSVSADDDLLIYAAKNRSAKYLIDMIAKLMDVKQLGSRGIPAPSGSVSAVPEPAGAASQNFDRSALDQLAYACKPAQCVRLKKLLEQLDTAEPNVVLRAVIYEVATSHNEGSAIQLAAQVFNGGGSLGVSLGSTLPGAATLHVAQGGLDAVIASLDNDSRFKSLSRPSVRVKTGAMAKFSVGSQVPILGAVSYDKNGTPVQSVEYRPSGTIFTVTPDVRADSIDLNVLQELSSFAVTTTGVNNSPTLLQRTASSTLTLHDREVIVFAGLEEDKEDESNAKLFGFIPLSRKVSNSKSEILLFIEAQRI